MQHTLNMNGFSLIRTASSVVCLSLLLSACGSESSTAPVLAQQVNINELPLESNSGTEPTGNTQTTTTPDLAANTSAANTIEFPNWVTYQDSKVLLRHPPELVVEPATDGESIQFLSPDINLLGGNDNCGLVDVLTLDTTLAGQTLVIESALYRTSPEPEIKFLEVNGEPTARIDGALDLNTTFEILGRTQIMHNQDTTYLLTCVGFTAEIVDAMFNSMVLVN